MNGHWFDVFDSIFIFFELIFIAVDPSFKYNTDMQYVMVRSELQTITIILKIKEVKK